MSELVLSREWFPALAQGGGERAGVRFLEFFTAQIRNRRTCRAYARAVASTRITQFYDRRRTR